jgi:hypothetical protein
LPKQKATKEQNGPFLQIICNPILTSKYTNTHKVRERNTNTVDIMHKYSISTTKKKIEEKKPDISIGPKKQEKTGN